MDESMCGGALRIDSIRLPSGGRLGLTNCPGRRGLDGAGRQWQRDLADDLAAIELWGAGLVVTFIEDWEFAKLGIPGLSRAARGRAFAWRHVPIADLSTPAGQSLALWDRVEREVAALLQRGESVVFHCAAGLGRSGTMAALILIDRFAMAPAEAISLVRSSRPGAIESEAQESFLMKVATRR